MKAILVIDMPKSCVKCEFHECSYYESFNGDFDFHHYCNRTRTVIENVDTERANDCPLKPMPNEREVNMMKQNEYEVALNEGWNACLEELEK